MSDSVENQNSQSSDPDQPAPNPFGPLAKSFLTVVLGALGYVIGGMLLLGLITIAFYPGVAEHWNQQGDENVAEEDDSNQLDDGNPEDQPAIAPIPNSFWGVAIAVHLVCATLVGLLVTRFAPMHPKGHIIMLAALLFLTSLQADGATMDQPSWYQGSITFGVPLFLILSGFYFGKDAE